jgi:signal transduction histidine kinase
MKWLLAKIFLGQLLLLSLSAVLIVILHMDEMTQTQRQYTSLIARGPLLLAAERLHPLDAAQRVLELNRLTELFGYPVRLLGDEALHAEITEVDPSQLQPILSDLEQQGVSALSVPPDFNADERAILRLEPGQVLVFGPIPNPFEAPAAELLQWSQLVLLAAVLMIGLLPLGPRLQRLADAADAVGAGDFSHRIGEKRGDALGRVARAFDAMAERMHQYFQQQRFMLRAVAHELRTPLARLRFAHQLWGDSPEHAESAQRRAGQAVDHMERQIDEILLHARLELGSLSAEPVPTPIPLLILDATEGLNTEKLYWNSPARSPALKVDRTLFKHALGNVLRNALDFAKDAVHIEIEPQSNRLWLHVDDDGPGIDPDQREAVLQAFVRLPTPGNRHRGGVGLGLAIADHIARLHGCELKVSASPLGGARFSFGFDSVGADAAAMGNSGDSD